MMQPCKKLILFDLDGVLIDSKKNMEMAWQVVQEKMNVPVAFEEYFKHIGKPFKNIMEALELDAWTYEIESLFKEQSILNIDEVNFYPNVETVLSQLGKTYQLGIITSKDRERTGLILSRLNNKFEVVATPNDALRGKPAPDHLLHAMAIRNVDPSETIYIGDMEVDLVAARRAKIDYIHALWGYESDVLCHRSISKIEMLPLLLKEMQ